jgi:hypothetical protein
MIQAIEDIGALENTACGHSLEELALSRVMAGWPERSTGRRGRLAGYEQRSLLELFATCLLVGLALVPYIATQEISRALGPGVLRRMLLQRPE